MTAHPTPTKFKPVLMSALLAFVIVTLGIAAYLYNASGPNYAKEVAKPIEDALVKAGAVKMCERGDSGRGVDNREPWYGAVFETKNDIETTKSLIKTSLVGHGFSDSNFAFDPQYKEWSISDTSNKSPYPSLKDGQIKFSATTYEQKHYDAAKDKRFCSLSGEGKNQDGRTSFAIGIELPGYK